MLQSRNLRKHRENQKEQLVQGQINKSEIQ